MASITNVHLFTKLAHVKFPRSQNESRSSISEILAPSTPQASFNTKKTPRLETPQAAKCFEQTFLYTECGHCETTLFECAEHMDPVKECATGYSLCREYEKKEIKEEKECQDCYAADKARKLIRKLKRKLDMIQEGQQETDEVKRFFKSCKCAIDTRNSSTLQEHLPTKTH